MLTVVINNAHFIQTMHESSSSDHENTADIGCRRNVTLGAPISQTYDTRKLDVARRRRLAMLAPSACVRLAGMCVCRFAVLELAGLLFHRYNLLI